MRGAGWPGSCITVSAGAVAWRIYLSTSTGSLAICIRRRWWAERLDRLALPARFDSPSLFAAILDDKKGGRFKISATGEASSRQMYVPDTNVLITRFVTPDGVAEIYDCMPIEVDEPGARARGARSGAGGPRRARHDRHGDDLPAGLRLCPRTTHTIHVVPHGCLFISEGEHPGRVSLLTSVPLDVRRRWRRPRPLHRQRGRLGRIRAGVGERAPPEADPAADHGASPARSGVRRLLADAGSAGPPIAGAGASRSPGRRWRSSC